MKQTCKTCSLEFYHHRKKAYCSKECYPNSVKSCNVYFNNCVTCQALFTTKTQRKLCCSYSCKCKHQDNTKIKRLGVDGYKRQKLQYQKNCPSIKNRTKYKCVQPLRSRVTFKICKITGLAFRYKQGNSLYIPSIHHSLSKLKYIKKHAKYHSLSYAQKYLSYCEPFKEKKCAECNKVFLSNKKVKKHCTKNCSGRYYRRIRKSKERARMREAKVETVDPFIVFKIQQWTCQQCGIDTPQSLRGTTEKNSPELDHIIPLSKGGEHSYSNVQLLCRQCNCNKSDNIYEYTGVGQVFAPIS